ILTGDEDISRFIKKTGVNNLNLLCRGGLPPNPDELLGSEKMQRTLDALAQDYSFIIIDSCPLLPVSDTVLLSTMVHSVIVVIRAREVSRRIVCKALERLEYVRANILGVVLNGIDPRDPDYGEYRRIYKSHYAHYAKTSAEELWDMTPTSAE